MRLSLASLVLSAGCLASLPAFAFDGDQAPEMKSISANSAKPGDTLVISGVGLNSDRVDEVYLSDQKFDMKVKVLEQSDTHIKVRVPPFAKPGRMQILCLLKGANPIVLEQPLYVLIKDPSDNSKDAPAPAVVTIQMKPEDLPPLGAPLSIPIVGAAKPEAAPADKTAAQVSQAKKTEPAKAEAVANKQ